MNKVSDWLNGEWSSPEYHDLKKENFNSLDAYLQKPPTRILDIGCGLAWESRMFNEKYGTELWLLDGDVSNNKGKEKSAEVGWNESSDSFLFYYPLDTLREQLDNLDTKNYTLVDVNNINIPDDVKFDVITSWVSCGFHYPANTYKDLILKHSHSETKVVFDLRAHVKTSVPFLDDNTEIVHILKSHKKRVTAEIRFKK